MFHKQLLVRLFCSADDKPPCLLKHSIILLVPAEKFVSAKQGFCYKYFVIQ